MYVARAYMQFVFILLLYIDEWAMFPGFEAPLGTSSWYVSFSNALDRANDLEYNASGFFVRSGTFCLLSFSAKTN